MLKRNEKYPIEVALERFINNLGATISWTWKTVVKFFFVIPKKKEDKTIYMYETLGWLLIGIGWIVITLVRFHAFGL